MDKFMEVDDRFAEIEPDKQAQILSAVKGPLTTRAIVATVESLYKTDVPWSPQTSAPSFKKKSFEIDSASSEMDKALVHDLRGHAYRWGSTLRAKIESTYWSELRLPRRGPPPLLVFLGKLFFFFLIVLVILTK